MTGTDGMFEFCHPFGVGTDVLFRVSRAGEIVGEISGRFKSSLLVVPVRTRLGGISSP